MVTAAPRLLPSLFDTAHWPPSIGHERANQCGSCAMTAAVARVPAPEARRFGFRCAFALLLPLGLAACGTISEQTAATAFVAPGKFDVYTCQQIEERARTVRQRELELEQLMARSAQGMGGQFVNAIAYQSDYQQARGELKALLEAAGDKKCSSQSLWSSQRSVF
jgi:hypothetical protein